MSTKSSLKEQIARRAATRGVRRKGSAFPTIRFVLRAQTIEQPVDLIRLLSKYGVSLKRASNIIGRLVTGQLVPVELSARSAGEAASALNEFGVTAWQIRSPEIEPRQVRSLQHLSQSEFAILYDLELDTLQNWEQGRHETDSWARVLLKIIETNPDLVLQVLTRSEDVRWSADRTGHQVTRS
jgi:DNA-binding transcriptional regulator YiaG